MSHAFRCKNWYGCAMSEKLPVNGSKWVEKLSRFNEIFIKSYNKNSDIGYFLEVDVEYPKKSFNLHKNLLFLPERKFFLMFIKIYHLYQKETNQKK